MQNENNSKYSYERVTCLILAGGLGTRLRTVLKDYPKVLAPVGGRPFISYLLDQLIAIGLNRVILSTGYCGDQFRETFGKYYRDLKIQYSQEPEPLGTGGAVRFALPLITSNTVFVMNGDSYFDAGLIPYFFWHFNNGHQSSLLLTKVSDTRRYGRVEINSDGLITSFKEKNEEHKSFPGWINAGMYLLKRGLIESIPIGRSLSLEREFLPNLIGKGLYGFQSKGAFIDIGTPDSYTKAEKFFAEI